MEDVIRRSDLESGTPPPRRQRSWGLWLFGLAMLATIIASAVLFWIYRERLGLEGYIFLGGLAVLSGIGLITALVLGKTRNSSDRRAADRGSIYSAAFFQSADPAVITQNGKPIHANSAYLDLARMRMAEQIEIYDAGGPPPGIERLFGAVDRDGASAIFRLHHMELGQDRAEEVIDIVEADDTIKSFRISVSRLNKDTGTQLWQISDLSALGSASGSTLSRAPIGLFTVDTDGKVLSANDVLGRWYSGDGDDLPETLAAFIETPKTLLESTAENGRVMRADTRMMTRKGVVSPAVLVARWQELGAGQMVAVGAVYGHAGMARRTATRQETADTGFVNAPVGVLRLQGTSLEDARILSTNSAFERLSGQSEWTDITFKSAVRLNPDSTPNPLKLLTRSLHDFQGATPYDAHLIGPADRPVSFYVVPDRESLDEAWVYLVDITARKTLENQLVQSQKMQAIGQLAAGVAHDFNNLLTAIRLNTDELLQRHPVGDPSYPELQNINQTGARAAALVKKLLAFSRQQTRRMELLDVTETLSDMGMTLRQTLGERAKLIMEHERNLPPVIADKTQVDTILMNLCVNARDAMAAQGGGKITVKSSLYVPTDHSESAQQALDVLPSDDFVVISVSDTGSGMSDEIKAKIFEPFFTTKPTGKGTGLGLATVYGIVQQSGGHLDVASTLGEGTTFYIYLPAGDADDIPADVAPVKAATPVRKPADLAGTGHILFVEDEASVRVMAAKSLRKKGYQVTEAENGEEALEILEDATESFDLMISDVVMPEMDGPTLLKAGRKHLGAARIVFISGYAEEEFSDLLSEEPDVTFLPKPFSLAQLAEKVKAEIGESV